MGQSLSIFAVELVAPSKATSKLRSAVWRQHGSLLSGKPRASVALEASEEPAPGDF